jgi:formylglycine-generating enzyme required for sulfatase activity/serine/threonine protein kinase
MTYYNRTGEELILGEIVGRGGEAEVYALSSHPQFVAKKYLDGKMPPLEKLQIMLKNPPADPTIKQNHVSIAWITDLLYDSKEQVCGYVMPQIAGGREVFKLYNPSLRCKHFPGFSWKHLHRTARNLSSAIAAIHSGDYVVGDLNESNLLVQSNTLITIIDTDSFQVKDSGGKCFRCLVGKAEYVAPEIQRVQSFSEIDRNEYHDRFALAVLVFLLLMEGSHPFRGKGEPAELHERIRQNLFPYYRKSNSTQAPLMSLPFSALHRDLQELFYRCFIDGVKSPEKRPSASDWAKGLEEAENNMTVCSINPCHYYQKGADDCIWCQRADLMKGVDCFSNLSSPDLPEQKPLLPITSAPCIFTFRSAKLVSLVVAVVLLMAFIFFNPVPRIDEVDILVTAMTDDVFKAKGLEANDVIQALFLADKAAESLIFLKAEYNDHEKVRSIISGQALIAGMDENAFHVWHQHLGEEVAAISEYARHDEYAQLLYDEALSAFRNNDYEKTMELLHVIGDSYPMSNHAVAMKDGRFRLEGKDLAEIEALSGPKHGEQKSFDGIDFVFIGPGVFNMGIPSGHAYRVKISRGFWIGKYEITQIDWRYFMGNNPSNFKSGGNYPVENVSWIDVQGFIKNINRQSETCQRELDSEQVWNDNVAGCYRLPTEAEWEYAVRAGTITDYSWGNIISCHRANYGNSEWSSECQSINPGRTCLVGQYIANPWGLHDMHGNVWEWVLDWYDSSYYGKCDSICIDPVNLTSASGRVFRGGGWENDGLDLRSVDRGSDSPEVRGHDLGFRIVLTVWR